MVKIMYTLFIMALLTTILSANEGFILNSIEEANKLSSFTNKPALVIFGADYCKFCNSLKSDILNDRLRPDIDKYIICYIDIKENPDLKIKYNVSMIPDSRIFTNNKETSRIKGYNIENYKKWIQKTLN